MIVLMCSRIIRVIIILMAWVNTPPLDDNFLFLRLRLFAANLFYREFNHLWSLRRRNGDKFCALSRRVVFIAFRRRYIM